MKTLYTMLIFTMVLVFVVAGSAEAKDWGLGVGVLDGDFGVQVRKDFWLGGDISQITGQGSVYFQNKTTFRVDADYHFIINPESKSRFYPLAGVQLAFNSDAVKFGLNAGGGFNFMLTESKAAFAEAKFVFGKWDGFAITGGIYF
jgi:hypothetical protein